MYGDFSNTEKSHNLVMRFDMNELYRLVVVSCVNLKPFLPVFVVEPYDLTSHQRQAVHLNEKNKQTNNAHMILTSNRGIAKCIEQIKVDNFLLCETKCPGQMFLRGKAPKLFPLIYIGGHMLGNN